MREILFRAKAINRDPNREYRTNYKNGDWIYGLIERIYDERFPNIPSTMIDQYGVSNIDVDYKTISAYTGLTDKNGKKIFEGDIIKDCLDEIGIIEYKPKRAAFVVKNWEDGYILWTQDNIEVIGNIFENPELLEESK